METQAGRRPFHDVPAWLSGGLLRTTEMAALAAARMLGRGDADRVKMLAGSAMLRALEESGFAARVVLGPRGDPMLSHGSTVGVGTPAEVDLAVYPVEGASLVARGMANAISVAVAVEAGEFPSPPAVWYMDKIIAGPAARGAIELEDTIADNLRRVAFSRDARVSDLVVAVLDRPRHQELIEEIRASGARVLLLEEGEIAGALMAAMDGTGVDAMIGIGGLQETIISACAVRCLGGELQARLWPRNDEERLLAGADLDRVYGVADLSPAEVTMALTGVSGGQLLQGVWFGAHWSETHSVSMSSKLGTVRRMSTRHHRLGESG